MSTKPANDLTDAEREALIAHCEAYGWREDGPDELLNRYITASYALNAVLDDVGGRSELVPRGAYTLAFKLRAVIGRAYLASRAKAEKALKTPARSTK